MHTFAQKKTIQKTASAKTTLPARARVGPTHEVKSILHLQRAIGNQAEQRLLQANAKERVDTSSTSEASPQTDES